MRKRPSKKKKTVIIRDAREGREKRRGSDDLEE